jgi:hypothetical protein
MIGNATTSILGVTRGTGRAPRTAIGRASASAGPITRVVIGRIITVITAGFIACIIGKAACAILSMARGTGRRCRTAIGRTSTGAGPITLVILRAAIVVVTAHALTRMNGKAAFTILRIAGRTCRRGGTTIGCTHAST